MILADRFFRDAARTSANGNASIHRSYQHFIEFFADRVELTEREIVIGCFFTYGWMPTILDLRGDLRNTIELVNRVKIDGCRLTTEELMTIASNVNGSVVGTSKLLHFIRPDIHATGTAECIAISIKRSLTFIVSKPPMLMAAILISLPSFDRTLGLLV